MNVKEISGDPSKYSFLVITNPQVTCFQAFMTGSLFLLQRTSPRPCIPGLMWDEWGTMFLSGLEESRAPTAHWQFPWGRAMAARIISSLQAPSLLALWQQVKCT